MDRLDAMGVFVAVAEEEGFAAAARRLRLSAPMVTRAIAGLEARVGAALLHRTTREVRLTEAGARYLAACRRLLADVAELDATALGADAEPRGTLTATAPVMFGRMFVAPVAQAFLAKHRAVELRLLLVDRVVALAEEGVDVAVRIARLAASADMAVRLGEVRRVVCASPKYLAQRGAPRRPRDLVEDDHELIGFSTTAQATPWSFAARGRRQSIAVRPRLVVTSTEVGIAAAVAGGGLTQALSYQVAEHVRAGRLQIVLAGHELPPLPIHVVHREGRSPPARVRAFVDRLVADLRANPALAVSR